MRVARGGNSSVSYHQLLLLISRLTSNDLLSLDPFGPNLSGATSTVSSSAGNTAFVLLCLFSDTSNNIIHLKMQHF